MIVELFAIILLAAPHAIAVEAKPSPSPLPYVARGDEVEKRYRQYAARLAKAHATLSKALAEHAPDLQKKLTGPPPAPVEWGYQILPPVSEDSPLSTDRAETRASSTSYSWPRTDTFLDWELPKIQYVEEKLAELPKLNPKDRHDILDKLVTEYPTLDSNQKLIDNHISYNRFWQAAIAGDKPRFTRLTEMHDMVLERQNVLDKIAKGSTPELLAREEKLAREIHSTNDDIKVPRFIKVSHPSRSRWILRVPVYTDIADSAFIDRFKKSIERIWHVKERSVDYQVRLEIRKVPTLALYKGRLAPKKGDQIDVTAHVRKFPPDGGVLTTGANSTYAIPGRYVALGPHSTSATVLAHEFGHILGFIDGYFRGFHDLGYQGYEVLEIVPDPVDIMSTPGAGRVLKYHFEKLIHPKKSKNPDSAAAIARPSAEPKP